MTRATRARPWSDLLLRLRRSLHDVQSRRAMRAGAGRWRLSAAEPRHRAALAQGSAVIGSLLLMTIDGTLPVVDEEAIVWIAVLLGFAALRVATAKRRLATTTIVLDAVGTAVFIAGTGGTASPFLLVALAGAWWSTDVSRGMDARVYRIDRSHAELRVVPESVAEVGGRRPGWLLYGFTFLTAYVLFVVPGAYRDGVLPEAFEDVAVFAIMVTLAEWFTRVQRRRADSNPIPPVPILGTDQLATRKGLERALHAMDIPVDAVLSAGEVGLTAIQAELLAYLLLGLTNLEIADATQLSESTVRYRLTRLYRLLGVHGRREAAERARMLGLTAIPSRLHANRSA
jgi:DNA-binding CsgD family transcriptional regulator